MNPHADADLFNLGGRVAVVTGGAGILGGEIACAMAGRGAEVAILDLDPSAGDTLRPRLERRAGRSLVLGCDVLSREALAQAREDVESQLGPVDILVNAAGGNASEATTRPDLPFFDLPVEALRFVTDLNFLGTVLACQIFGRAMADRGSGVVLNISSMNALRPLTRIPAYSAAKAAVSNFTQWLAVHMAQEYSPAIRVNALAPGFFVTEQNRFLLLDEDAGALTERGTAIIAHTPMGRFGEPRDLVGTALWLLSEASSFVTGVVVPVDGGFSAFSGV